MKYLIAGTGGVGGSIAGFLSLAGKDVTCIARGAHLQSIQTNGLKLKSDLKGEQTKLTLSVTLDEKHHKVSFPKFERSQYINLVLTEHLKHLEQTEK